jgi:hypothetical protein
MRIITILLLILLTVTGYAQKRQNIDQLVVKDSLTIKAGNPAANKIATSIDGNGRFRWQYFSVFQDSINTGVYDSLLINYLNANSVRVKRDSFTDPAATIASVGDSGFIVECFTCDTIQYILDNLGGGGYSPWDTTPTKIVQKDTSLNVVVGTNYPIYPSKLFTEGEVVFVDTFGNIISTLIASAKLGFINLEIKNTTTNITNKLEIAGSNASLSSTNTLLSTQSGISFQDSVITLTNGTQADGYVLTSDASGNATWQDKTAYGEMGFGDSTRTLALTQNVWSVVTNTAKNLLSEGAISLHNVTYQADSLTIDSAGTYLITANISVDGQTGSVIEFGIFKNGVLMCTCTGQTELLNNRIFQISYNDIAPLTNGDGLRLVLMNTASNDDVDLISAKLTINKIR